MDYLPDEETLQEEERRLSKESAKALRAAEVFENEEFQAAVEKVRQHAFDTFARSDIGDDETRKNARMCLGVLEEVLDNLKTVIDTGKFAHRGKQDIEQMRRIRDAEPGENSWQ